MEILPTDLGQWRTVMLIRMRASVAGMQYNGSFVNAQGVTVATHITKGMPFVPPADLVSNAAEQKPMGFWTRFWAGSTKLEPDAARHAVRNMSGMIGGFAGGLGGGSFGLLAPGIIMASAGHQPIVGVILAATGAAMAGLGFGLPRYLMEKYATHPLTLAEVEMLTDATDDVTEKAFLGVIGEVLRQPELPDGQAAREVRAALQTLGEAIDKLPRVTAPHQNMDELQTEARKAWADADAEPDTIIAASLRRRAEAQEKTAQAAQRTTLLVRRSNALRREIEAQIEALRMGLSGFDADLADAVQNHAAAQNAAAHLGQLAASVQTVAREAGSLHDARDEVATWVDETTPTAPAISLRRAESLAAPEIIRVGGGSGPTR